VRGKEEVMAKKILIVDDEPDIVKVVSFRLKKEGYDVEAAVDGQQGLDMAFNIHPDLILLDVTLPKMNGYEVCRRLKADAELKDIPVVFMTASLATGGFAENFPSTGAQGYIFKPFDYEKLLAEIHKFLS